MINARDGLIEAPYEREESGCIKFIIYQASEREAGKLKACMVSTAGLISEKKVIRRRLSSSLSQSMFNGYSMHASPRRSINSRPHAAEDGQYS